MAEGVPDAKSTPYRSQIREKYKVTKETKKGKHFGGAGMEPKKVQFWECSLSRNGKSSSNLNFMLPVALPLKNVKCRFCSVVVQEMKLECAEWVE